MSALAEQFITNVINQVYQIDNQGGLLWVTDPNPRDMGTVSEDWTGPNGLAGTYYRSVLGFEYDPILGREVMQYSQSWNSGNIGVIMGAYEPTGGGFDLYGGEMTDVLLGAFANPDNIHGGGGSDVIFGAGGPDTLSGGTGNDFLVAGITPHVDILDYCGMETATAKYDFVPLMYESATIGRFDYAPSDPLNIQHSELYGGVGDDTLIAGVGNDKLYGGDNSDILLGGDGNDSIYGDGFNEKNGNAGNNGGNDYLMGEGGNDSLVGGIGNDTLDGGAGADAFDGGDGIDIASYGSSATGIVLNLGAPDENTGDALGDTFQNIEAIFGSNYNDILFGDDASNEFHGFAGNDTFYGGNGVDFLLGGAGNDTYVMNSYSNVDQIYEYAGEGTQDILQVLGDVTDLTYGKVDNHLYFYGNNSTCLSVLVDWFSNGGVEYLAFDNNIYSIADLVGAPATNGMTYALNAENGPVHVDLSGVPDIIGLADPAMTVLA